MLVKNISCHLMNIVRGNTKKDNSPYARVSLWIEGKLNEFFLMGDKLSLVQGVPPEYYMKPFAVDIDFYSDTKGVWKATLTNIMPLEPKKK